MLKELFEDKELGKYLTGKAYIYIAYAYMSIHEFEVILITKYRLHLNIIRKQ